MCMICLEILQLAFLLLQVFFVVLQSFFHDFHHVLRNLVVLFLQRSAGCDLDAPGFIFVRVRIACEACKR